MDNIKHINGNIFTTSCQTTVNTINCVGVMGAGIALEYKYRYPAMYDEYVELCKQKFIDIGKLWIYKREPQRKWVLNFPTKKHWKFESKEEYLVKGLQKFGETWHQKGIRSIAFPILGADKGGLDKGLSIEIMEFYLSKCDLPVEIYHFTPSAKDDLIDLFQEIFRWSKEREIENLTGFTKSNIKKIKNALERHEINSLMQLGRVRGIGESTMEKCFQFIVDHQINYKEEVNLFNNSHVNNGEVFTIPEKKMKKEKKKNELLYSEKAAKTGLDMNVLFMIEKNEDDVTIKDLKTYCQKLNINLADVLPNFFGGIEIKPVTK